MTNVETCFNGYVNKTAFSTSTAKDFSFIKFFVGEGFKETLNNPLKIVDGRTFGQQQKDHLHEKLDEWINENLKDKK